MRIPHVTEGSINSGLKIFGNGNVPNVINETKNKRPMGHIAHLKNLGPYRNIFPISNMYFISICSIRPSGGPLFLPTCFCSKSKSFHVKLGFSGFIILKKIFK
jgi:hypothetical protein